jgi:Methyltransferase domain
MVSSAILESLPTWGQLEKRFWLIDTFLPYWTDSGGEQTSAAGVSEFYASGPDEVAANFAEWPNVEIVQGRIPEILDGLNVESVAYLHIDLNAAAAERSALAHFWPLMSTGAIVLFDDYGFGGEHRLQKAAVDEFAAGENAPVLSLPTGQGLMVK